MGNTYAVIMAGGSGERFWPLSTAARPKQFLRLLGHRSLVRATVDRVLPVIPVERQFVVTGSAHADLVRTELPELPPSNVICEPIGRNTAACIGLASLFLERCEPDAVMVALPADHHIPEPVAFLDAVEKAVRAAEDGDAAVTIGIKPARPETGYGYVQIGTEVSPNVFRVLRFHEKPDAERAGRYLSAGDHFWNSGIFVGRNRTIQRLLKDHLPDLWSKLASMRPTLGTPQFEQVLADLYPSMEKVSIDHGVLEKAADICMVRGNFAWDDVGSWTALDRLLPKDDAGNVVIGRHAGLSTSDCIIHGAEGKVIATIGVCDLIIVDSAQGILVCPKSHAQNIRDLLRLIGDQ